MKFLLVCLFASLSIQASFNWSNECSPKCRMAIFGSAEEFAYHSGASSTLITEFLIEGCSEEKENPLAKNLCQMPDEWMGTIEYAIQAGCVYEYYKEACGL